MHLAGNWSNESSRLPRGAGREGDGMGMQAIGEAVRREEDPRLLTGRGRYVDDVTPPNEARGWVLRSPYAHASIAAIDVRGALAAPGALAVLTGDDLERRGLGTLAPGVPRRRRDGRPAFVCPQPLLARGRVRYVGDPVAFVVAATLNEAKDAAERIVVDYRPLPAAVTAEAALAQGAPAVWDENPGNEAFFHEAGNKPAVDAAFARAQRIVRRRIPINRVTANAMEPRGCLGDYDRGQDRYTIRCTIQSVHATRAALADRIFKLPQHRFRVVCDNMGGGFGMKGGCYPEYALSLWASEVVGRPVKWIAERGEGLLSDEQGRGSVVDAELALDADGRFLALRAHWRAAIGAYFSPDRPTIPLVIGLGCLVNTYGIPAVHAEVDAVLTNTMTIAPYRGGSRPEPLYVIETIIDAAARELGLAPAELRRRNTIPASAMPFTTCFRQTYDTGDFPKNLEDCLRLAQYDRVGERRAAARRNGKLLGVGVATTVAATGGRDYEHAEIRFDPSGGVVLLTGSMDHGQGHGTTFKQVLSQKLGIDADLIRYRYGDSDLVTMGIGTFGSRSAQLAGSAIVVAADRLIDKGRRIAAHMLEAATDDVVFAAGRFAIAGTDRSVGIAEVARRSFESSHLPNDIETGFAERANFGPADAATFPSGAHLAEVEIDAETGAAALTRYVAVDDVGRVLNPLLCEGQIAGGIVQGVGQALFENLVYDPENGQLLSGSFQDYCMPRADDFCAFDLAGNPTPTAKNPLGVKGVGEAGTLGAIPAAMNAVNDALAAVGAPAVAAPATPEKLWRALRNTSPAPSMAAGRGAGDDFGTPARK
jgi:aerobic carbon-monoxide dehydrogenase large subunit